MNSLITGAMQPLPNLFEAPSDSNVCFWPANLGTALLSLQREAAFYSDETCMLESVLALLFFTEARAPLGLGGTGKFPL